MANLEQLRIQPMQPQQAEDAAVLVLSVAHAVYGWQRPLAETLAIFHDFINDVRDFQRVYEAHDGLFLVVMDGERLIGTGAIRRVGPDTFELKRIYLRLEYHGLGVGYRLVSRLLEHARRQGAKRIVLQTDAEKQTRAIAFYRRIGFVETGRGDDPDDMLMEMGL
jgi:putative acetyltransferase